MSAPKPRLVGLNHIAIEVGDGEDALRFYEAIFSFELRGSHRDDQGRLVMAFVDMGDQFLALSGGRTQPPIRPGRRWPEPGDGSGEGRRRQGS